MSKYDKNKILEEELDTVETVEETPTKEEKKPEPKQAKPSKIKATVTATLLNVRADADGNSEIVTTVANGEALTILEEKNGFGKIADGKWVNLKFVKKETR